MNISEKDLERIFDLYEFSDYEEVCYFIFDNSKIVKYLIDAPNHIKPIFSDSKLALHVYETVLGLSAMDIVVLHDLSTTEALLKEQLLNDIWFNGVYGENVRYNELVGNIGLLTFREQSVKPLKHIETMVPMNYRMELIFD
jgi:hypothetical protein